MILYLFQKRFCRIAVREPINIFIGICFEKCQDLRSGLRMKILYKGREDRILLVKGFRPRHIRTRYAAPLPDALQTDLCGKIEKDHSITGLNPEFER